MVLFPLRMVSARKAPPNCVVGGPCELCAGLELSHESCRATKRRQEYICRGGLPDDDVEDETGARGDSVSTTKKAKNNDEDDDSSSSSSSSSSSNNRARRSALEQHLDQHHARLKGRRIKAEPLDEEDEEESAAVVIYRSCERTADDDVRAVIWFEVGEWVGGCVGAADCETTTRSY
jgi:hypothetical protein